MFGQGGRLLEGRASHLCSFLHSYLPRSLSGLKLVMAYVECLLCAGHGRGPHDESQEEGTLICAAWLDLCVPRWCPGAVVGARRECHELAVGPSGLGGLLEEVALQRGLEGHFR